MEQMLGMDLEAKVGQELIIMVDGEVAIVGMLTKEREQKDRMDTYT